MLSLGVAAGLHGAALAYALAVHEPKATEQHEQVVTVELVDASMLPDESEPSPPTDKLPSAAASGATQMAAADPESDPAPATDTPERLAPRAATAPELGETEAARSLETASLAPPVEPEPDFHSAEVSPPASAATAASPAAEAPVPDSSASPQMTVPPIAQIEPPLTLEAPTDEPAAVTLPPPLAATEATEVTPPKPLPRTVPIVKARPHPVPKKIASLEPPKRTATAEPKPKVKPKKKAELPQTDGKSGAPAKPKAKKLAALPTDGTNDASAGTAKAKSKANNTGKTKTKGTTGSTSSGKAGIGSYWNSVRARVMRSKVANVSGRRGTATITVGVTPSGALRFVRVSRSSGVAALDQAALATIRRAAPFPAPPAGTSSSLLQKDFPIQFR